MNQLEYLDALVARLWYAERATRDSASQLMRQAFREEGLKPKQQRRVKERFHALLAGAAMIDYALGVASPGGIIESLEGAVRVLASRVMGAEISPKAASARFPWIDWKRVAGVPEEVRALEDPLRRLELEGAIPAWLARRLQAEFGEEAQACVAALSGRAPVTLRANTLRCSREELVEELAADGIETKPTRYASAGIEVLTAAQLFRTRAFARGAFEMQDEASQLVAEIVAPPPGALVVDACAGAGGKTLALAAMMGGRGSLVALDSHGGRLQELRRRARRAGVQNLRVLRVSKDGWNEEVESLVQRADRVLLDAPCSGLGSLRRNPDMRGRMQEEEICRLQKIQVELLERSARLLAPHARVIYATCTILPQENQEVVARVRQRFPELDAVRVVEILGAARAAGVSDAEGCMLQTYPHRQGCDGFFAAVLRRPRARV